MTTSKRFELIARYIVAANDVIDICGPDSIASLRVLLKAAHDEAVKGTMAADPNVHAGHVQTPMLHGENGMRLN